MDSFTAVCERVASYGSRLKKIEVVAEYLRRLSDEDLARAVHLFTPPKLSIGGATLREACRLNTDWDAEILSRCYEEVGDTGETIGLLLAGRTRNEPLSLEQAEATYTRLFEARTTAAKIVILRDAFASYRPLTLKYFVKVITGNLRIGLQSKMIEEAIALATDKPHDGVRLANNRLGDLARVALAARHGQLDAIEARLFHPMDFMLAKPLEKLSDLNEPQRYVIEDKYDGIRSQIHVENGQALIYTRGMDEVTGAFPEVHLGAAMLSGSAILDGEILAWKDNRALAFTVLQQRLARKKVTIELMAEIPVVFIAYDLLYRDGELLIDAPFEKRRALMEQALGGQKTLLVSRQHEARSLDDVETLFQEARARGNEGLILKLRESLYEPGRRSGTWYKLKRPYATLDVVITAAEQGHGRRATVLSDYTFAVRASDKFLNVGKAYSGLTDKEIRELTRLLRAATLERFGRVALVRPEIVLEVAFDGVQKSPRHKSGYALRFPRIVRWRQDKKPEECDTLERIAGLYEASLHR